MAQVGRVGQVEVSPRGVAVPHAQGEQDKPALDLQLGNGREVLAEWPRFAGWARPRWR